MALDAMALPSLKQGVESSGVFIEPPVVERALSHILISDIQIS